MQRMDAQAARRRFLAEGARFALSLATAAAMISIAGPALAQSSGGGSSSGGSGGTGRGGWKQQRYPRR